MYSPFLLLLFLTSSCSPFRPSLNTYFKRGSLHTISLRSTSKNPGGSGDTSPLDPSQISPNSEESPKESKPPPFAEPGVTSALPDATDLPLKVSETEALYLKDVKSETSGSITKAESYRLTASGHANLLRLDAEAALRDLGRVVREGEADSYVFTYPLAMLCTGDYQGGRREFYRMARLYEDKFGEPGTEEWIYGDACGVLAGGVDDGGAVMGVSPDPSSEDSVRDTRPTLRKLRNIIRLRALATADSSHLHDYIYSHSVLHASLESLSLTPPTRRSLGTTAAKLQQAYTFLGLLPTSMDKYYLGKAISAPGDSGDLASAVPLLHAKHKSYLDEIMSAPLVDLAREDQEANYCLCVDALLEGMSRANLAEVARAGGIKGYGSKEDIKAGLRDYYRRVYGKL